ncbi:MAG: DUF362 domain-containing protein [Clostridia bacterium]|nr:DUF362 domain-containing protein [Clostridia bacterium]
MPSKVYFTKVISPESVLRLFEALAIELPAPVAVKVHTGEKGNQNFLPPSLWEPAIRRVNGTVVETNTAYEGERSTTEKHLALLREHGWDQFPCRILDGEGPDRELAIPKGFAIQKNYIGKDTEKFASVLVLTHFKGHPMGGYGGALKQLSIGFASAYGKKYIHGVGKTEDFWNGDHDSFLRAMADAAGSVLDLFRGKCAFVSVMKNMSVDCDCCAVAEDPCMQDIGVLSSLDPVALDRACLDLVYRSEDPGRDHLLERIETRNGTLTPAAAAALGLGSLEYELVSLD